MCTNIVIRIIAVLDASFTNAYLHFRWSSNSQHSPSLHPRKSTQIQNSNPIITVEGRGRGVAVVQMRNTFYTINDKVFQSSYPRMGTEHSETSSEAFNLEPTVKLKSTIKGAPPTQFWINSCQK